MPGIDELAPEYQKADAPRPIIFLGGVILEAQKARIETDTRTIVQNAADVLQKAMLHGLVMASAQSISLVNLPFVGTYPSGYRKRFFPATTDTLFGKISVIGMHFSTLPILRLTSRFNSARHGLAKGSERGASIIIVYSAHLPFLVAALLHARRYAETRICLVLPDLPQHMSSGRFIYRAMKSVEAKIFTILAKHINYFVVLTKEMAIKLDISPRAFCVIEGIYDNESESQENNYEWPAGPDRIFLYTGTLAVRYGIVDLVKGFQSVDRQDAQLWICGEGDAREEVVRATTVDSRIKYFGQVSREKAVALQTSAHVLCNPRQPSEEFTKYSFPSKTIEYLAAGRPVLMHDLPGVPSEYRPYLIIPQTPDASGLFDALQAASIMPENTLKAMGAAGRDFVISKKSSVLQARKILDLISHQVVDYRLDHPDG